LLERYRPRDCVQKTSHGLSSDEYDVPRVYTAACCDTTPRALSGCTRQTGLSEESDPIKFAALAVPASSLECTLALPSSVFEATPASATTEGQGVNIGSTETGVLSSISIQHKYQQGQLHLRHEHSKGGWARRWFDSREVVSIRVRVCPLHMGTKYRISVSAKTRGTNRCTEIVHEFQPARASFRWPIRRRKCCHSRTRTRPASCVW
jgi:hypothetical protein